MSGIVHVVAEIGDDWPEVIAELTRAFEVTREAARAGRSVVYVVHTDDLLGRRGPERAMVATGLLSAARTAALEGARKGWTVNVVARDQDADADQVRAWAEHLLESGAVTGEVVRVGPGHLGKALP